MQVIKRYRALVWGRLEGRGRLTWELDGRRCDTEYLAVGHSTVDVGCLGLEGSPASSSGDGGVWEGLPGELAERQAWVTTVDLWPHTGRCAGEVALAAAGRYKRAAWPGWLIRCVLGGACVVCVLWWGGEAHGCGAHDLPRADQKL